MYCFSPDFGVGKSFRGDFTFDVSSDELFADLFVEGDRDCLIKGRTYCFRVLVNFVS